jgi:DNA polymerase-3 subunit delta
MHIKQSMLPQLVQKKIAPLYMLLGQDPYLLEESLGIIKCAIKKIYDYEEHIITVESPEDWNIAIEEANTYSLFSDISLLLIVFDKKTIDLKSKKLLIDYLGSVNPRCFIVIKAPNLPVKQVQALITQEHAIVLTLYPLNQTAMKNWITTELRQNKLNFDSGVPELIYQYTQGNMLACAQVIEKIKLSNETHKIITKQEAQEQLSDQCNHDLFELVEVCLQGFGDKAIQILRHAAQDKTEPTLVLWILTQEVRTIMQLTQLLQQQIEIKTASAKLKIWPQRINLYQACCKRFTESQLKLMHRYCYFIDEGIKSGSGTSAWRSLEYLALSLCTGQLIGDVCPV